MPPYRRILVATDFSSPSERAVQVAASFAPPDVPLVLAHVFDPAPYMSLLEPRSPSEAEEAMASAAQEELDRIAQDRLGEHAAVSTIAFRHQSPPVGICELAEKEGADLIVVGTRGRTGLSRMLLGSCAARLVRHAACDVLVVRGDTDVWHTERIVAPTDLSDNGSAAVVAAGELRRSDSDVLTLLHVVDESVPIPSNRVFGLAKPEDVRARVLTQLEAMRDERFGAASTVTCAVRLGESPVQGICNFAREDGCGLVVVATHGRTGLSAMLIGSVAESVVAEAPCPVLVVRNEPAPS